MTQQDIKILKVELNKSLEKKKYIQQYRKSLFQILISSSMNNFYYDNIKAAFNIFNNFSGIYFNIIITVYDKNKKMIGYLIADNRYDCEIAYIFVERRYRKKGIGRIMLKKIINEQCKNKDITTKTEFSESLRFFIKSNFRVVGKTPENKYLKLQYIKTDLK